MTKPMEDDNYYHSKIYLNLLTADSAGYSLFQFYYRTYSLPKIKYSFKNPAYLRETPTLSTNADCRTDTNLKGLRGLSIFF